MADREIILNLSGGEFRLSLDSKGGSITSDLHYASFEAFLAEEGQTDHQIDDWETFGRYEGAIEALESFVLAAAHAGINVQDVRFKEALQTTLDAIGNEL